MNEQSPGIALVKIPVSDFAASTLFYREVLGLPEEFAVAEYGWAQYRTGGVPLCLYQEGMGGGNGSPGGDTGIHLAVAHIEDYFTAVSDGGATIASELVGSDDGGKFFEVADPDGNTLKICQAS